MQGQSREVLIFHHYYFDPANCSTPAIPRNGKLIGSSFAFQDKVHFQCHHGYNLFGLSSLTCLSDGKWSAPLPTCECKWFFLLSTVLVVASWSTFDDILWCFNAQCGQLWMSLLFNIIIESKLHFKLYISKAKEWFCLRALLAEFY